MFRKVMEVFSRFAEARPEKIPVTARMFAESVNGFSSQYGGENSRGYTAANLAGESYRYPSYGDFTEACVMRTYGPWWCEAPSAPIQIGRKEEWFLAEDFVDLYYPNTVNPERIDIYETYNPGSVVRILACNKAPHESFIDGDSVCWEVLWSGPPVKLEPQARLFSPTIKTPSFATRLIRIELNQSLCDYYTELDAVYMTGTSSQLDSAMQRSVDDALEYLDIGKLSIADSSENAENGIIDNDSQVPGGDRECSGLFQFIPDEVISHLLTYLTFRDLGALAQCCRFFRSLCYDPLFYKELNLKPFWSKISNKSLEGLITRCRHIEKLDMSWLGPLGAISVPVFNKFLTICGSELTHLRLSACDFLDENSVGTITTVCTNLLELNLASCNFERPGYLSCIKNLKQLRILNLYRIPVPDSILTSIFMNCSNLEFLNFGSNTAISNGNDVLENLGSYCKNLRGLDLWRCKTVDARGIVALCESCPGIEELDFGWCASIKSHGQAVIKVAESCPKLKKLFLTAVRSTSDEDVDALAKNSLELEQFDILGTANVHPSSVFSIDVETISQWHKQFPRVSIKKSFTS